MASKSRRVPVVRDVSATEKMLPVAVVDVKANVPAPEVLVKLPDTERSPVTSVLSLRAIFPSMSDIELFLYQARK